MRSNLSALLAVVLSLSFAPLFVMSGVFVLCGFAASSPAAIVHYGNDVEFPDESLFQPDYLLGSKYTVTQPIVLQKAGIIFKGSSVNNAKVGIYTDAGGVPNTLVAETGSFEVYFSTVLETPLMTTPTIPAGDYWFMAVFDEYTSVGVSYDDGNVQAAFVHHNFNSLPLPATFPAPTFYTGSAFNYYLVGETTTSGDFNHDGTIDAADYVVWRKGLGTTYAQEDFNTWRANFGRTVGRGGGGSVSNSVVPEPGSLVLFTFAVLILARRCRLLPL